MPFKYTGFADESERSLDGQVATLREVKRSAIELRLIDGKNVCDFDDAEWAETWGVCKLKGLK